MGYLSKVKEILESVSIITAAVFVDILNALPSGLSTKLRITPDNSLPAKLAHLLTVCKIESNEEVLPFEYESISVEGSRINDYMIDHDAIVKNLSNNKDYLIDCTSNPGLIRSKREVMVNQIRGLSNVQDCYVHVYNKKRFVIDINRPDILKGKSAHVFDLFDKISQKPKLYRNQFFQACEDIYDILTRNELQNLQESLNDRYVSWESDPVLVEEAVKLAQCHNITDASKFKLISSIEEVKVYYNTFTQILEQQRPLNQPFNVMPAKLNFSNALKDVLLSLSDNLIVKAILHASYKEGEWVGVSEAGVVSVLYKKPLTSNTMLPADSEYAVCAKNRGGHMFNILFSEGVVDDNFLQQVLRQKKEGARQDFYSKDAEVAFDEIMRDYRQYGDDFMKDSVNVAKNTIMGKISSMAVLYSGDSIKTSASVCATLAEVISRTRRLQVCDLIDHSYEIAKSFAASLKLSPREDCYYVGVNGPFESLSIVRMSSTQDSFNVASYFCIYKAAHTLRMFSVKNHRTISDAFCQTKTRTFNRNTLAHALKFPFVFVSLLTWEIENNTDEESIMVGHDFRRLILNSVLHISVNSDQFSQCAEQLRYLFTSNIGYGASAGAICDKIKFVRTNTTWELLYLFRMLKLACSINLVFKNKKIGHLIEEGKWCIALPNSVNNVCSFSHLVSSMYYANIYNKFRAFHEVSEAICYNELEEENLIYLKCLNDNEDFVHGISRESYLLLSEPGNLKAEEFIASEVRFCKNLLKDGPGRFKLCLSFIIGATNRHVNVDASTISDIYKFLSDSPVEACTMRGAMEDGYATVKHQSVRATTSILEELVVQNKLNPAGINSSVISSQFLTDKISENSFDFSIFSAAARQFNSEHLYRYRIVQKDQKGHREISVLNAKFRLGALFCERTAQIISKLVPSDVLDDAAKDIVIERKVRDCIKNVENETVISDNSDQKRWGPNHLLHSFSAMFFSLLRDDLGLFRILNLILHFGENKMAKFPENLIDLMMKKYVADKSIPLKTFMDSNYSLFNSAEFERKFEWGMCQGIFHRTSSLYHGIMCFVVSDVCKNMKDFPDHTCHSFVTSDDAERIITINEKVEDRIMLCKQVHSVINNVGCLMNILRNESKSVFSFHITEFNSVFYHNGFLATPTLKQRISKIDIGDGADPVLDFLTALSLSMAYFQNGGSYFGTCVIMLLNVCLHTEQWNRWAYLQDTNNLLKRPVEFGGFPCIEPLTLMYCGPISSFFLRSLPHIDYNGFSHMVVQNTMVEAKEVDLDDFSRNENDEPSGLNMKVYKTAGPLGVFSFSRTDRRLSRFEKRHKISSWKLPDEAITLDKNNSDALKFVFNLQKITKTCQYETLSGTNSFYIRFTDPWVNNERKCLRLHENSFFVKKQLSQKFDVSSRLSFKEMNSYLMELGAKDYLKYYDEVRRSLLLSRGAPPVRQRLIALMDDAEIIYKIVSAPMRFEYITAQTKNCIAKVNLGIYSTVDEDAFFLSLLKSVVGDKIKSALIEYTSNPNVWGKINVIDGLPSKEAIEGIHYCTNIIQVYDKFIRRTTKTICPSNVVPKNISELMHQILTSRFTEKFGIKIKRIPLLRSSNMRFHAFFTCNNDLLDRSVKFWHDKEDLIDFTKADEPSLFGIRSTVDTIHPYDDFIIDEEVRLRKKVQINAIGKYSFIAKLRMWTGACVNITLNRQTMQLLVKGELTNLHEYCIDKTMFIKNQTRLLYEVKIGDKNCLEIQEHDIAAKTYRHFYLYEGGSAYVNVDVTFKNSGKDKTWVNRIVNYLNDKRHFKAYETYVIPSKKGYQTDSVSFIPISSNDIWQIKTFPNNLSIFIQHLESKVIIPVCSQQIHDLNNINLDLKYTLEDMEEALLCFSMIGEKLVGYEDLDDETSKFVSLILFRTSVFSGLDEINNWIADAKLDFKISSIESADILRSLILCNTAKKLVGNRVRIHHYFLNLFRNSPNYNNGITSIKTEAREIGDKETAAELEIELGEETINFAERSLFNIETVVPSIVDYKGTLRTDIEDPFNESFTRVFDGDEKHREEEEIKFFEEIDIKLPVDEEYPDFEYDYHTDDEDKRDFVPFAEDAPSITTSMYLNRPYEECNGMINEIQRESKRLKPKRAPRKYYAKFDSIFDVLKALASIDFNGERSVKECIDEMYNGNVNLFDSKYPYSAMCLAELYFV